MTWASTRAAPSPAMMISPQTLQTSVTVCMAFSLVEARTRIAIPSRCSPRFAQDVRPQRNPIERLHENHVGARVFRPGQVRFAIARHDDDPRPNGGPGQQRAYEDVARNVRESEIREHDVEREVTLEGESRPAALGG